MERILVSACLAGRPVRYDGRAKTLRHALLARWRAEGRLVALCPEIEGGMAVPRLPAEIEPGAAGAEVIAGRAKVREADGRDVTDAFLAGAERALRTAQAAGCRHAVLAEASPSCGSQVLYSGRFDGHRRAGTGVTAALLEAAGIRVWPETALEELAAALEGERQGETTA